MWMNFWITRKLKLFLANWEVFFEIFLMEFIVCMYLKICVLVDTQGTLLWGRDRIFYPQRWTYDPQEWCTNSIKPFTLLKKRKGMKNLVQNIFCSITLFKEMINYRDISKKLILETFTSSSSFSNSRTWKVRFLKCYFIVGPNVLW